MLRFFCGLWLGLLGMSAWAEGPTIVVSIMPLYHIAQAVMGKTGEPVLLVPSAASEHAYALKPSQYAAIADADLVVWIGPELETFLTEALAKVPADKKMTLVDEPYMIRYNVRQDPLDKSVVPTVDPHLWLDPFNAMTIARQIEKHLVAADPDQEEVYKHNTAAFMDKISILNTDLEKQLTAVQSVPYVVFHDAFQYFEKRYGLKRLDSIAQNPHVPVSAARWVEMSALLKSEHIPCIFSEPQNQMSALKQLAAEGHVRLEVLNPLGEEKPAGTEGYAALLTNMADGLTECLASAIK